MTTELDIATNGQPPVTRGATRSALAITPDQTDWNPAQLAALRQLGLEDAPEGDLAVFRHVCMTTGLDPFRRQIYMIGRNTKVNYYDERQKQWVNDWTVKYTIQTGIDGFRRNGRAAAKREGATIRVDGPYWQGADGGGWTDVWLSDKPPAAAKFTIFRDGEAHTGIAMYREFVQTDKGGSPNSMWSKMPANQTAKCAEAQAWRRAYPDDFAGMQLEDAMQVLDGDQAAPTHAHSERVTAGEILAAAPATAEPPKVQQWQPPAGAETASDPVEKPENAQVDESPKEPGMVYATANDQRALSAELERHGHKTAAAKRKWLSADTGREITSAKELTVEEAVGITVRLRHREAGDMPILQSQWNNAAAMLEQLGADSAEKKLFFLRNFLERNEIRDPLELNEREAGEVLQELNHLIADEAQDAAAQLPIAGAEGGE